MWKIVALMKSYRFSRFQVSKMYIEMGFQIVAVDVVVLPRSYNTKKPKDVV